MHLNLYDNYSTGCQIRNCSKYQQLKKRTSCMLFWLDSCNVQIPNVIIGVDVQVFLYLHLSKFRRHILTNCFFISAGTPDLWPYLLLLNAVPALISLVLLPFVAESPRYLHLVKKDRIGAEKALRFFLQKYDVSAEIEEMETESTETEEKPKEEEESYTMKMLFLNKDLRMPLMVAVMLQVVQQLSGINAVSHDLKPYIYTMRVDFRTHLEFRTILAFVSDWPPSDLLTYIYRKN